MGNNLSKFWAFANVFIVILYFLFQGLFLGLIFISTGIMHWIGYYHLVIFLVSLPMSLMLIIGIVLKIDFFRKLAIGLTWWSLITAPIVRIANLIYSSIELDDLNYVMEYLLDFRSSYTIVLFILLRIYIILVLRKHNAGYLFSRDE